MGWKGALRSIEAAGRRAERDARRRHNELLREQKQRQKMLELERAAFEVELYENHIDLLRSIHKECGPVWDWRALMSSTCPEPPARTHKRERIAEAALQGFEPNFWDKLLRRVDSKRTALSLAVQQAEIADANEYLEAVTNFQAKLAEWQEKREIAERVLAGDVQAYREIIEAIGPFSEMSDLGSSVGFRFENTSIIEVTLTIKGHEVIPNESKSLLQSGKLSTKKMPQGQFYDLYQDYICGCALRIAREIFALLPFDTAIVTAVGDVVNTQTGIIEEKPLLSIAMPRSTLSKLNLNSIDPSDSMKNFIHHMNFKKNKGFMIVDRIPPSSLSSVKN
jgi:hypothetical protein